MLAGRDQHARPGHLLEFRITPIVVGRQRFLDPFEPVFLRLLRQAYRIVEVEAHPTIEHEPEVIADPRPHLGQLRQILFKSGFALGGAVMKRQFATDETQRLCQIGARTGRVEWLLAANRAAQQMIDGLAADLAEEVPKRKIDAQNRIEYQSLAAVVLGGEVHLVPDEFGVFWDPDPQGSALDVFPLYRRQARRPWLPRIRPCRRWPRFQPPACRGR